MEATYPHLSDDSIGHAVAKCRGYEPEKESWITSEACGTCGGILDLNAKVCPSCGDLITTDARAAKDQIEDTVKDSYRERTRTTGRRWTIWANLTTGCRTRMIRMNF